MNWAPFYLVGSVVLFSFEHPLAGIVLMIFAILEALE